MAIITIYIDNVIPDTDTGINVTYRWHSQSGLVGTEGNGDASFSATTTTNVVNQSIIALCVQESTNAGVTIGDNDRKILASGIV